MSSGTQNIPLIRLEQRVEDLKRGFKLNTTSSLITLGAGHPVVNITATGQLGINVLTPNTLSAICIRNNDQISWQNASSFVTRVPDSVGVATRDAGARIYKSSDNNFYIDSMDGNTVFRRGGVPGAGDLLYFSNTVFISGTTGNVGFSNSAPEARIHVGTGDLLLENNRQIQFKNASGATRGILRVGSSGLTSITSPGALSLNVNSDTAESQAISIASDGRVNVISNLYTSRTFKFIPVPEGLATAGSTISAPAIVSGLATYGGPAGTVNFPSATVIDGELPSNSPVGTSFQFVFINAGTGTITMAGATGLTFLGVAVNFGTFSVGIARTYLFRKTGSNAFDVYTISTS